VLELSEVEVDPFVEASGIVGVVGAVGAVVGVVGFPDASVEEDENNENVFPNIPFPEGSVTGVGFPDASVDDDENNENDSKFGENNDSIVVVPPNNDESISFYKSVSFKYLLYYNYN
jgi:hypothetical protein